jgi:hypothetical protein
MASGNPLLAKEIYNQIDAEWFERWAVWKAERRKAKVPDSIVGIYSKE